MADKVSKILQTLLLEDLSGVVFVRDYLQLQFNPPPTITVYSRCSVESQGRIATIGDETFPNILIAQIGKKVGDVTETAELVILTFEDGSRIVMPYAEESGSGAEAIGLSGENNNWCTWPP
jgi:hypothetical protein